MILVAREIGESGDLDQKIDINRQDEIGDLARTFNNMMTYLKEMAAISEAIAGGDLTVAVEPRSKSDTLAHAFSRLERIEGGRRVIGAMRAHPELVRGPGEPDTTMIGDHGLSGLMDKLELMWPPQHPARQETP